MRFVTVNQEKVRQWSKLISSEILTSPSLVNDLTFKNREDMLNFIFLFCSINFCFWSDKGWSYKNANGTFNGSTAVLKAIFDAYSEGRLDLNPESLINMSFDDFVSHIKGEGELMLLEERYKMLIDNFKILKEKYEGSVDKLFEKYEYDLEKILAHLPKEFVAFEDKHLNGDETINVAKKLQVLVSNYIKVTKEVEVKNQHKFTLFADYRIPQLFRHLGFIEYSPELADLVDNNKSIERDSEMEKEIRISTIKIGEMILKERPDLTAASLDTYLWGLAKSKSSEMKPHHRTLTTNY